MPYLGRSPGSGVRSRFIYAATSGQTSFSGNDSNSVSLAYEDTLYMDVYQNGVLLKPVTDYAATTGTSVVLTTGATTDDVIEMIVYDTFAVADTVSASNGGTFAGAIGFSGGATFPDSAELVFGADSDFKISHNGSKTKLEDTGTGNLEIRGTNIEFYSGDGGETLAKLTDDGAAELYHNNTKRIETSSTGVDITGAFTATDGCTITTADNTSQLTLTSTDADATAGPRLDLKRDSGSPADNDTIGRIRFLFDNDAAEQIEGVRIDGHITDASDSTEDTSFNISTVKAGSMQQSVKFGAGETVFNESSLDLDFRVEGSSIANLLVVDAGNNHVQLGNSAVQYRSDTNGLHIGKDTENANTVGTSITASGFMTICRNAATVMSVARNGDDGGLINLIQGGNLEGGISVSGSTVSFTGGHLSRWSQLADNTKDTSILKGTVMTNLDKMAVWHHEAQAATYYTEDDELPDGVSVGDEKTPAVDAYDEDNEQLNCMAVSSVEGDANVAGVFVNWDNDDDDFNDMNIAMTGDMVIRIASGTTVARGDLLMSAGDGTAKPQDDDIVRSKTIAKVTSTTVSHTYDDGSYLLPCVLMAC